MKTRKEFLKGLMYYNLEMIQDCRIELEEHMMNDKEIISTLQNELEVYINRKEEMNSLA
jgi:hypothetical protein